MFDLGDPARLFEDEEPVPATPALVKPASDAFLRMMADHKEGVVSDALTQHLAETKAANLAEIQREPWNTALRICYSDAQPLSILDQEEFSDLLEHPAVQMVRRSNSGTMGGQYLVTVHKVHSPKLTRYGKVMISASVYWKNWAESDDARAVRTWLLATAFGDAAFVFSELDKGDEVVLAGKLTSTVIDGQKNWYLSIS